jgi:hypothetical protein
MVSAERAPAFEPAKRGWVQSGSAAGVGREGAEWAIGERTEPLWLAACELWL